VVLSAGAFTLGVDELFVHIAPVLLGDGTRVFSAPGGARVALQALSATQSGSVTHVRYRVLNTSPPNRRPA
jgi:riboflavin biosynthesis pyrimidine reductase